MLVLTRQVDEEIVIGGDIRIKVLAVNGGQVRLGIDAPAQLSIYRREIYDEICRENLRAAEVSPERLKALADPTAAVELEPHEDL